MSDEAMKAKLADLTHQIRRAERAGDDALVNALLSMKSKMARKYVMDSTWSEKRKSA